MQSRNTLVAKDKDLLVGYTLGYIHSAFYANGLIGWMEELYVLPRHRGKGTGELLLSKFEETLLQNDAVLNALAARRQWLLHLLWLRRISHLL